MYCTKTALIVDEYFLGEKNGRLVGQMSNTVPIGAAARAIRPQKKVTTFVTCYFLANNNLSK